MCLLFNGPIVGTDLWKSRECGYGECQSIFSFSAISYPFIALYDDGSCILRVTGEQSFADADLGYFKYPEYYSESVICMGAPLGCCRFGNCNDAGTYVQYGYSAGKTEESTVGDPVEKVFYHPA